MTGRPGLAPAGPQRRQSPAPELAMAAIALGVAAAGADVVAGTSGAALVVIGFAVAALGVTNRLAPAPAPVSTPGTLRARRATFNSFGGYWRLLSQLGNGSASLAAYRAGLGPQLQHLFAARLSEHHGVNLYQDPEAARRVLCAERGAEDLWPWLAPQAAMARGDDAPGIPLSTLSRLVRRLELI